MLQDDDDRGNFPVAFDSFDREQGVGLPELSSLPFLVLPRAVLFFVFVSIGRVPYGLVFCCHPVGPVCLGRLDLGRFASALVVWTFGIELRRILFFIDRWSMSFFFARPFLLRPAFSILSYFLWSRDARLYVGQILALCNSVLRSVGFLFFLTLSRARVFSGCQGRFFCRRCRVFLARQFLFWEH